MRLEAARFDGESLILETKDREAIRFAYGFQAGDYEIVKKKKRRSLDANSYFWVILDKLSDALSIPKEELYLGYVKECGPFKDFTLTMDEAKTFKVAWSRLGVGWQTEQVDYAKDGNRVVVRAYFGSSTYNTKQMSRIIDLAVQDAKQLGIETMTEKDLSRLKEDWNAKTD